MWLFDILCISVVERTASPKQPWTVKHQRTGAKPSGFGNRVRQGWLKVLDAWRLFVAEITAPIPVPKTPQNTGISWHFKRSVEWSPDVTRKTLGKWRDANCYPKKRHLPASFVRCRESCCWGSLQPETMSELTLRYSKNILGGILQCHFKETNSLSTLPFRGKSIHKHH